MTKQHKELKLKLSTTVEQAVNLLIEYRDAGELVMCDFNGFKLYSDTVTMDNAYLTIVGKTKDEFDIQQGNFAKRMEEEDRKHKEEAPKLIEKYTQIGKELLDESKHKLWSDIVPVRVNDIYKGWDLKQFLDLVPLINDKKYNEAKYLLENQDHSGMSYSLVCSMIHDLTLNGAEFVDGYTS